MREQMVDAWCYAQGKQAAVVSSLALLYVIRLRDPVHQASEQTAVVSMITRSISDGTSRIVVVGHRCISACIQNNRLLFFITHSLKLTATAYM
jgi:hypothetical protein